MTAMRIAAVSAGMLLSATASIAAVAAPSVCTPDPPTLADRGPDAGALRTVNVDAGATIGTLRSLQGVNGAPAPGMHKPPGFTFGGWNMPQNVDTSRGYREARIDLVRTHDAYGPGDIDARFTTPPSPTGFNVSSARNALDIFPDASADPENPKSYNFAPTDRLVASIVGLGAQAIFRLGRSETSDVTPPKDFARYASVVEHIVLHYNRGWAHGFHYGLRYWEVWNEPDLGKLFWGGTPQQYYRLYAQLAAAVKRADPTALVGGPTLAKPNDDSPYQDGFLRFVRAEHVPLDFYSWHWYATDSDDPLDFVRIARDVRARLDRFGFAHTLSVLDEWNYGLVYPLPSDIQRAAFVATSLIYMEHAPIDLAALYRADNLFGLDGATPDRTGGALIALGRMQDTPLELAVQGADSCGFAVEAGRSPDGRTIQVLISNYEIPAKYLGPRAGRNALTVPHQYEVALLDRRRVVYGANRGYDLTVTHLRPGRRYTIERYRISPTQDFELSGRAVQAGGAVRIREVLPPPGIELVVIRDGGPAHRG
jgi:xylan 1,4-beta-xylosidase